jgi:hypothetical protein
LSPRRARAARWAALALALALGGERGAASSETAPVRLRYGWSAGQTWLATSSVERETHVGDDVQRDHGVARFEYTVGTAPGGELKLEARMLSQETEAGAAPLDFSPIVFGADIDDHGRLRGAHFTIAESPPPVVGGKALDPLTYHQVLNQVATAWRSAVLWFPDLPERSLSPGQAFVVEDERDLGDAEPGVAMRVHSTRTYRLLSVADGVARFRVEEDSRVGAGAGASRIDSRQHAEGEALFDLELGMWMRHQLVSSQRASYSGSPAGAGTGEATSRSVATIEMQRPTRAAPPPR